MTELERCKKALALAECNFKSMASYTGTFAEQARNVLRHMAAILNPPPEMETVEVVRWTFGDGCDTFDTEEAARDNATYSGDVYKLTGQRQRPKPQKVERSVSIEAQISQSGVSFNNPAAARPEWTSHPEVWGKTGTLTFTYTE